MKNSILGLGSDLHFFLCQKPVNMNLGIEGLRGLIFNQLGKDPQDGSVYIFLSRNRKIVKLLHFHDDIYTMYTRKIYRGSFIYPTINQETDTYEMDWVRLRRLVTQHSVSQSQKTQI